MTYPNFFLFFILVMSFFAIQQTKKLKILKDFQFSFCTPDENRTHIVGTGIRYSIH